VLCSLCRATSSPAALPVYRRPGCPDILAEPSCTKAGTVWGSFPGLARCVPTANGPGFHCSERAGASGAAARQALRASPRGLQADACRQLTPFWARQPGHLGLCFMTLGFVTLLLQQSGCLRIISHM